MHYISNRRDILCSGYPCHVDVREHTISCPDPKEYGRHEVVKTDPYGWVCLFCHETQEAIRDDQDYSDPRPRCHDIDGELINPDSYINGESCEWFSKDGIHRLRFDGYSESFRTYVYRCPCGRKMLS